MDAMKQCIELMRQRLQDPLEREIEALLAEAATFPDGGEIIERCLRETELQFVTEDREQ